jgi:hypothetical protein
MLGNDHHDVVGCRPPGAPEVGRPFRMQGRAEAIPMDLRVTEVFRREEGEPKLVHRHADPLTAEAKDIRS